MNIAQLSRQIEIQFKAVKVILSVSDISSRMSIGQLRMRLSG